ncbi:MAG: hypothetical protein WCA85_18140 [Paraburkholderia sp.]|uniref:hypothetical protein n=1 Tax=Paraburkholderia sp. TaxID=1926495 RepID=UPI003C587CB0
MRTFKLEVTVVQKNLRGFRTAGLPDAQGDAPVHSGQPLPVDAPSLHETLTRAKDSVSFATRFLQYVPFFLILIAIALVAQVTLLSAHSLAWNQWAYSEWLINYDAGFIRRGLSGALIDHMRVPPLVVVNVLVFVVFTSFCLLFWRVLRNSARSASWAAILAMLVPNGPVQMAAANEFFYRKEIVFHVALGISCILYQRIVNTTSDTRRVLFSWIFFALLMMQVVAFPLLHEVFLFISFPASWLLARQVAALQPHRPVFGWLLNSTVIVSIGMMVVCAVFRGNQAVADQLWKSLSGSDRMLISPSAPDTPTGGIAAIGWSTLKNLSLVGDTMVSSQFWIWIFVAAGAGAVLALITALRSAQRESPDVSIQLLRRHLSQLWFLFVASLPMYVLGWDWARWISSVAISYLFLSFADSTASIQPPQLLRFVPRRWRSGLETTRDYFADQVVPAISTMATRHRVGLIALALFYCMTFRPPECCMQGGYNPYYRIKPVLAELSHLRR